ncbi:hypothetical protein [Streptomyces tendae]|uniref:hypothetical protein n=1 Tax=Streptomyces tendae TaxID=1932 RepID=UPI003710A242
MSRYGLRYDANDKLPPIASDRRYGLVDETEAINYGYHLPKVPDFDLKKPSRQAGRVLVGETAEYNGKTVPPGGCVGEASKAVRGDEPDSPMVEAAQRVSVNSFEESRTEPQVLGVIDRWSRCMNGLEFSYASPLDPPGVFIDNSTVTQLEKSTATADVKCKKETDLVDIWLRVETRIQQAKLASFGDSLSVLVKRHEKQVANARAILARPTAPSK